MPEKCSFRNYTNLPRKLIFASPTELHTNTKTQWNIHESSWIITSHHESVAGSPKNLHLCCWNFRFFSPCEVSTFFPNGKTDVGRFCLGQPPSELECYAAALIYAVIYASRWAMPCRRLPSPGEQKKTYPTWRVGTSHWLRSTFQRGDVSF